MNKATVVVKNMDEMKAVAASFLNKIIEKRVGVIPTSRILAIPRVFHMLGMNKKSQNTATVIGLRGDLGAGKTTFTKTCANILGINENVTSPTFVILKKYEIKNSAFSSVFSYFIHIDAYRLKNGGELNSIGWKEITSDPKNLIFIEWPEIVPEVMPKNTLYIDFKHVDETTRKITL